jgi:hypothetical protein
VILKFSDAALKHIKSFAIPIPPWRRSEYLLAISSALKNIPDPEPAQVYRAARAAQQKILYGNRPSDGSTLDGRTALPLTARERYEQLIATNPRFKLAQSNGDGVIIVGATIAK